MCQVTAGGVAGYDLRGGLPGSVSGQGVAMEFRILGSFEVVGSTGLIDLRGAKRRGLLACLVVHAGQPLSTDLLVEELWGDGGSGGAARTVQTYVSQLRRLLHDEPASLTTRPGGYVLEVDPADVDAQRFERGVIATGTEPDPRRLLAMLDQALNLWRGAPLREFAGAEWADREATRLEALYLLALHRRHDTLLELDRAVEAAAELEPLVRSYPLDERLWGQLMVARYRSGRQADALSAYQQARRHLVDELGIEPGPELSELEHRILHHDPSLATATDRTAAAGTQHLSARGGAEGWYPRTFLLTDIVDSVSLWERDPAAMSQAMARHVTLIRDVVSASTGELVRAKGEGDSTFSVFVHPSDALAAAAAIHEAVAADLWPSTPPLRVRTGVHTGDAEPRDGDWYGPAVNRAARLRALADGGQTLVSGVTAGLVADNVPDGMRLLYRGRRVLRGIERPEEVWELVAADDSRLAVPALAETSGLPFVLTRFVGRSAELERLVELTEGERLVTLTGPGGGGKTRLAVELARDAQRRGQAVWLAELAPVQDGQLVAETVAAAVGVEDVADPVEQLLAEPERLDGLLVLDNCEHLLDDCAALAGTLLAAAPGLRVLATSREPLGLTGERVWPVKPLELPDGSTLEVAALAQVESVELLLDRARAVRPDLEVGTDDMRSVVRVCRALDGIPLAIELAAVRLRSLSLGDLASRLGNQPAVLARHRSTGPDDARHRTLRLTLDWSYDLLTDDQQTLARRLSVFAGGFRLDAVESVCGTDLDVLDGIDELVAKSLVTFDPTTARYRLLEPIRQYLAERLDETGATETLRRGHAAWVSRLCDRLGTWLAEDRRARSRGLREESNNIELALRWAQVHDPTLVISIVGSLGQYWTFYDQASGRRWSDVAVKAGAGARRERAKVLLTAGMVAQNDDAQDRSITLLRESLALYRTADSAAGQATALFWLGRALAGRSGWNITPDEGAEAMQCFEESLRLSTLLGDSSGAGWCRVALSWAAFWSRDLPRSERLADQVVEECSTAGASHPAGQALHILAHIAHARGQDDSALEFLQAAVTLHRDIDERWHLGGLLFSLAIQQAIMGGGDEALQTLAEASRLYVEIGRRQNVPEYKLAAASVIHLARGERTLSIAALGAYLAHVPDDVHRPRSRAAGFIGGLVDVIDTTRAQLNSAKVAAARTAACGRSLDELIDELIIQPANNARHRATHGSPDDG
jgi:predicted ATPase/DNA-binding SARP family transcriptional activator